MWQGHLTLKNESAAVQLHFLSGNVQLAKSSLPGSGEGQSPAGGSTETNAGQAMYALRVSLKGTGP